MKVCEYTTMLIATIMLTLAAAAVWWFLRCVDDPEGHGPP